MSDQGRVVPRKVVQGEKLRGEDKTARIPVKIVSTDAPLRKPDWIRVRIPVSAEVERIKEILRRNRLASVCEEASCPNLGECFGGGTATFMVMGEICTRRCPFCDVAHGRPNPLDQGEPAHLAAAIAEMGLRYVVITSVDRDDLRDGGAAHFADCIRETRARNPEIRVEVLVPDFRGRMDVALDILAAEPPDVQSQHGDRQAAVSAGATGLGFRLVAGSVAALQAASPRGAHQIGPDARSGRNQ
jgi:lipoic acid synthetase